MFTNSPRIFHITKRDFSHSIAFPLINKYAKGAVVQISTVFGPVYHVAFPRVLEKRDFLDIYRTTVFRVGNVQNISAMSLIFFLMFKT